jgi:hypothetical protein
MVLGDRGTGYIRVDWYSPDGLGTWGDGRLFILGTEGYIELRKYIDIAGRKGGNHLNGGIIENLVLAARHLHRTEPPLKSCEEFRVRTVDGDKFSAAPLQRSSDPEDVVVIRADYSEFDGILRFGIRVHTGGRYFFHYQGALILKGQSRFRERRKQPG